MSDNKILSTALTPQVISLDVLQEKYCKGDETTQEEIFRRVAKGIAAAEKTPELQKEWEEKFYWMMTQGAMGAGRIMSAAGTDVEATLNNCYVTPVGDSISGYDEDGLPGIYIALRESAETLRRGGGVGYDFSRIRPKNAKVKSTKSHASGPCSYMDVFDASCRTVESAGSRRGAQMGVLRIDHPDVLEFITAKREKGRWNNFNVSVNVSNAFMYAVKSDEDWELAHKAEPTEALKAEGAYQRADGLWVYKKVKARDIWDTIMQSTYDFAEPGILFMDNTNQDNNLSYCEKIEATNPCGEQPLPPYGCCDLGQIFLTKLVRHPFTEEASFDWELYKQMIPMMVRFLDNVLDVTLWPLDNQYQEAMAKRRVGLGYTGLGDAMTMLKIRYDSQEGIAFAETVTSTLRDVAYATSVELAKEKGAFPLFDREKYITEDNYASRLPHAIREDIKQYGIRNSHLTSIAPVGTLSLAFGDNCSNGLEPAFSWGYKRKKRNAEGGWDEYMVEDHAFRVFRELGIQEITYDNYGNPTNLPDYFVTALEMNVYDHVNVMSIIQKYIDSSISKTTNIPADYPFEDFKGLYLYAWEAGLKGLATYRPNDTLGSILSVSEEKKETPQELPVPVQEAIDPMKTTIERRPEGKLDAIVQKIEYYTNTGLQRIYLAVSFIPVELPDGTKKDRAIEFFMPVGQNGESQQWITATMRSLSLAARGGFLERALEDLRKVHWDRGPIRYGWMTKEDGSKRPIWHDSEISLLAYVIQEIIASRGESKAFTPVEEIQQTDSMGDVQVMAGKKCNTCGAHAVIKKDGCEFCTSCGEVGSCG